MTFREDNYILLIYILIKYNIFNVERERRGGSARRSSPLEFKAENSLMPDSVNGVRDNKTQNEIKLRIIRIE